MSKDRALRETSPVVKPVRGFPTLQFLATLLPDSELLLRSRSSTFEKGSFTNTALTPRETLGELLRSKGYQLCDGGRGMLFSSIHGVPMHSDDGHSVLWVLKTPRGVEGPQLLVEGEERMLYPGDVLLFNSRKRHGVIAYSPGTWTVFSCYVKKVTSKRKGLQNA